jgi:serine/threonine protein phosphatase PrpC
VNHYLDAENFEIGGHTDVGRRAQNEDTFLIDRELGLIVVADGVGGHQSGQVASRLTCEVLQREIAAGANLGQAIDQANREVIEAVQRGDGKPGMGSTVVALLLTQDGYDIAWVGDSRAYLWDGKLSLLTRDHSLVEAQLAAGRISLEEARTHRLRNVILQAVGLQEPGKLDIGTNAGKLAPDSCLLLCSDGVTDPLDNAQLCQLLSERTSAVDTCRRMIDKALQCGGRDNATAVLIYPHAFPQDPPAVLEPLRVAWVYDPETAEYAGLPDVTMHHPDYGSEAANTQVLRGIPIPDDLPSPSDPISGENRDVTNRTTGRRYIWLAALLGMLALVLVYAVR